MAAKEQITLGIGASPGNIKWFVLVGLSNSDVAEPVSGPTMLTPVASRNLADPVASANQLTPVASRNLADV